MEEPEKIKVGFCVAYDWELLRYALPAVYTYADVICLSLDVNLRSWSGKKFSFDKTAFRKFVSEIDTRKKIGIYEDDFSLPDLSPAANEVRQRNLIGKFLGEGGWHIQLDCDEYFLDFGNFVKYLDSLSSRKDKINVMCPLITLFKKTSDGYLMIQPGDESEFEYAPIATRFPLYEFGRKNGYFNIYTNFAIVHQSWARSREEIVSKLQHWGHSKDFDPNRYIELWDRLNDSNYLELRNFHPIRSELWPALKLLRATDETHLLELLNKIPVVKRSALVLAWKNSKIVSRAGKLASLIGLKKM